MILRVLGTVVQEKMFITLAKAFRGVENNLYQLRLIHCQLFKCKVHYYYIQLSVLFSVDGLIQFLIHYQNRY